MVEERKHEVKTDEARMVAEQAWRKVVENGDRDGYRRLVEPLLEDLERLARHEIVYHVCLGDLDEGWIDPEELVGETLSRAWRQRRHKPEVLSLKAWLAAVLLRTADDIAAKRRRTLQVEEAVSLEDPAPEPPIYDDDEEFWEWYQPDDYTKWEDVLADDMATPEELAILLESRESERLPALQQRALVLHDEQRLPLREVAVILRLSVAETRNVLREARANIQALAQRSSA
ncbi:MAG: RNA polymerase sigma factor [Alphaproteobacteria bacterium]|nr:MAG: RNA polymerase sigma factor [Alphaproteobacteria bacterium]